MHIFQMVVAPFCVNMINKHIVGLLISMDCHSSHLKNYNTTLTRISYLSGYSTKNLCVINLRSMEDIFLVTAICNKITDCTMVVHVVTFRTFLKF